MSLLLQVASRASTKVTMGIVSSLTSLLKRRCRTNLPVSCKFEAATSTLSLLPNRCGKLETATRAKPGVRAGDRRAAQQASLEHGGAIVNAVMFARRCRYSPKATHAQAITQCLSAFPINLGTWHLSEPPLTIRLGGDRSDQNRKIRHLSRWVSRGNPANVRARPHRSRAGVGVLCRRHGSSFYV